MLSNPRKELGKILHDRRISIQLTLEEVAVAAGMSISHLGRIENAERFPSGTILRKIARPLGFDENELFMMAGYLTPQSLMNETRTPYSGKSVPPDVLSALSREPVELQRAAIDILKLIKKIAANLP